MSAAATAAGYLYASGRLRGRNGREGEQGNTREPEPASRTRTTGPSRRREVKVAVYPTQPQEQARREEQAPAERTRPAPKIQYRTRRWKPE